MPDESPREGPSRGDSSLQRVRVVASLLDDAIRVPGTNLRFGIDPLIGLVPGLGDVLGGLASAYIILEGARAGAPTSVLLRMAANVGIDTLVGTFPLVGDFFDFAWKSNTRNARLLARHVEVPTETKRASAALVVLVLVALGVVVIGAAALAIYIVRRLLSY